MAGSLSALFLAAAIAIYVTNAPAPFVDREVTPAEASNLSAAAQADWNPNQALTPEVGSVSNASAASASSAAPSNAGGVAASSAPPAAAPAAPTTPTAPVASSAMPSASTDAKTTVYFIQVGAFATDKEADTQKARLNLLGLNPQVTRVEQSGQTFFRVRLGPYTDKGQALDQKNKLAAEQKIESALIPVAVNPSERLP